MHKILIATLFAATLAGASTVPAFAGEGGGDPFPLFTPGEIVSAVPQGFDVGRQALPVLPDAYSFAFNGVQTTVPNSREGEVQTAGSLPRNALVGTVEYAQAQSVARWFASRPGLHNVAVLRTTRSGG